MPWNAQGSIFRDQFLPLRTREVVGQLNRRLQEFSNSLARKAILTFRPSLLGIVGIPNDLICTLPEFEFDAIPSFYPRKERKGI